MWMTHHERQSRFGIDKFGLFDGPTMRGARTVVDAAGHMFEADFAALVVFDDLSAMARLRIASDPKRTNQSFLMEGSASSTAREAGVTMAITSASEGYEHTQEVTCLGVHSMLLCPVFGPETTPIALLALMHSRQRSWSSAESESLENLAHLISQELILKASFETLHIMRRQQMPTGIYSLN